ncbi:hypothetical protein RS130_02260 [Paraglaciecola aquimarina]|uniref:Uncharacterized protein n=1 Tax=Paraglaciecola aquimarina TaxID=1235557 RepID=A0ABU3SSD5_9ALTE|nr:hypothetical protein [Paraglaciecola aquimarina]MDU0352900.1 hypothetical protein [Paraglaciecola aquimarina]
MKFEITSQDDISCITLRGTLNALDMIFMIQSPEYQEAISANRKLLFDYTEVDDFKLTPEDVMGITLLGKKV